MLKTAPCGRGSVSILSVYSDTQSRDHRERSTRRVFQNRLQAAASRRRRRMNVSAPRCFLALQIPRNVDHRDALTSAE